MKIKSKQRVVVATTKLINYRGFKFCLSHEDLESIAISAEGCPVLMNFDPKRLAGKVSSAHVTDNCLVCELQIISDLNENSLLYCVPNFIINGLKITRLSTIALTTTPLQKGLTPLKVER